MRLPVILIFLLVLASHANARELYVKYDVSLMALKIGEGKVSIKLDDNAYSISGQGEMVAFGNFVSDGSGNIHASGTITPTKLAPSVFNMNAEEDGKPNTVSLKLNNGKVMERKIHPAQDRMSERIKVTEAHKNGVIDPLSAILFAAPKGLHRDSCNRTIEIYDGRDRYDIVMRYKAKYKKRGGKKKYSGDVLICSARYKPISGHRPNRKTIQQLSDNTSMEIHLAGIQGEPYLLLYRASLMTPAGKVVAQNVKYKVLN